MDSAIIIKNYLFGIDKIEGFSFDLKSHDWDPCNDIFFYAHVNGEPIPLFSIDFEFLDLFEQDNHKEIIRFILRKIYEIIHSCKLAFITSSFLKNQIEIHFMDELKKYNPTFKEIP